MPDPDAHRDPQATGQFVPLVPGDPAAGRLADSHGLVVALTGQDERELLAAEARAEGAGGQVGTEDADQALQHAVTEQMPPGVVDQLEVVDVDQRDRQPDGAHGGVERPVEQRREALVEVAAIVGGRQAVAAAQLPRLGVLAAQPVQLVARSDRHLQEPHGRPHALSLTLPPLATVILERVV